jgi:hypothetical protein
MYDIVSALIANFYEGFNFFLLWPILAFVLTDFTTIKNPAEVTYYYLYLNLIDSSGKLVSLLLWHKYDDKKREIDGQFNIFGKRTTLIYGLIFNGLSYLLFGFSYNIYMLFAARFLINLNLNIPLGRMLLYRFIKGEDNCLTNLIYKNNSNIIKTISWYTGGFTSCIIAAMIYNRSLQGIILFKTYPLLLIGLIAGSLGILLAIILALFKFKWGMCLASVNEPYTLPKVNIRNNNMTIYEIMTDVKYYPIIIANVLCQSTTVIFALLFKLIVLNSDSNGNHIYDAFHVSLAMAIAYFTSLLSNIMTEIIMIYRSKNEIFTLCSSVAIISIMTISYIKFINTSDAGMFSLLTVIFSLCQISLSIIGTMLQPLIYKAAEGSDNYELAGIMHGIVDVLNIILEAILSLVFVFLFAYVHHYRMDYSIGLIIIFSSNVLIYLPLIYMVYVHSLLS